LFFDSRIWLTCKRILSNFKQIKQFYKNKKNTKVIYFEVPTDVIYGHIKYDMFKTVSNLIENAKKYDLNEVDGNIKKYFNDDWPDDKRDLKILLKLLWLIKDLKKNQIKTPFQLLFFGNHYMFHPGTTRILVASYLLPQKCIKGFYIWNQNIDNNPFILDYYHEEIKNPLKFLLLFSFFIPFRLKYLRLTEKINCNDSIDFQNNNRMFQMAQNGFLQHKTKFEVDFLTFHQSTHWNKIKKGFYFRDNLKFHDEENCTLVGLKFKKINDNWVLQK
jgi:hypothetical protein